MLRLTVSAGRLTALAFSMARRSRGFMAGSPPPWRAATMISRMTRVHTLPRFSSWRPLRCWMFAHLLCPATVCFLVRRPRAGRIAILLRPAFYFSPMADPLLLAKNGATECFLLPGLANRHGLITGATGTGKTVTLQTLAENFSRIGVPVFMADVKGDLTGISQAGTIGEKMAGILQERGIENPVAMACPATLWDVFGEQGHPVRATVSDMGPLLLGRMLNLNETQAGVLNLVFKIADDNGMLLLDLKDLRAMLQYVGDNASEFTTQY